MGKRPQSGLACLTVNGRTQELKPVLEKARRLTLAQDASPAWMLQDDRVRQGRLKIRRHLPP